MPIIKSYPRPIQAVIEWAMKEVSIRSVILVGSRATDKHDPLSDYDFSIFCAQPLPYISVDGWLNEIGNVWVCVHEKIHYGNEQFPTRLVIFENGIKVDFTFLSVSILKQIVSSRAQPSEYDTGYKVLIDKDSLTVDMCKASFEALKRSKPTKEEFLNVVKEFWFEAYHVGVYLKRGDLWLAKIRSQGMIENFLLKMIEWNELSRFDFKHSIPLNGKMMQSWVSKDSFDELHGIFAHFDYKDSWKCLLKTMKLFRNLSIKASQKLDVEYPEDLDRNLSNFILNLCVES